MRYDTMRYDTIEELRIINVFVISSSRNFKGQIQLNKLHKLE